MGYLLKAGLGLGGFAGAVVLFNVKLVKLLETGTCASGNQPFQIARPCPEGTGTDIVLLMVSVVAGLIAIGLFSFRGRPPWAGEGRSRFSLLGFPVFSWGAFFTATGATSLIHALTSETIDPDAESAAIIVGITFLLMGLPALILFAAGAIGDLFGSRDESAGESFVTRLGGRVIPTRADSSNPASGWITSLQPPAGNAAATGPPGPASPADDPISQLERLQRLRESGALTETEFQAQKRRVLDA